jgi:hypothetical protein
MDDPSSFYDRFQKFVDELPVQRLLFPAYIDFEDLIDEIEGEDGLDDDKLSFVLELLYNAASQDSSLDSVVAALCLRIGTAFDDKRNYDVKHKIGDMAEMFLKSPKGPLTLPLVAELYVRRLLLPRDIDKILQILPDIKVSEHSLAVAKGFLWAMRFHGPDCDDSKAPNLDCRTPSEIEQVRTSNLLWPALLMC